MKKIIFFEIGARRGAKLLHDLGNRISYYGFEPEKKQADRLESKLNRESPFREHKVFDIAVMGEEKEYTLYLTKHGGCNSIFEPNYKVINKFSARENDFRPFYEHYAPAGQTTIKATTLDKLCSREDIKQIDYLQLDTQGSELPILHGASDILKNTFLINAEMRMLECYKNEAMFYDICALLYKKGFRMIGLPEIKYTNRKPVNYKKVNETGELFSFDGIFINESLLKTADEENLEKYITLLSKFEYYSLAIDIGKDFLKNNQSMLIKEVVNNLEVELKQFSPKKRY